MTTKTLSERITDAEALLAELKAKMSKPEPVSDGRPAMGQRYFALTIGGSIAQRYWSEDEYDLACLSIGNVYLTREAADREVERRKVIKILRDMAGGFKPDWSDRNQQKWLLNFAVSRWLSTSVVKLQDVGQIYFATEEAATAAIAHLGDRLNVLREG